METADYNLLILNLIYDPWIDKRWASVRSESCQWPGENLTKTSFRILLSRPSPDLLRLGGEWGGDLVWGVARPVWVSRPGG